MTLDFLLAAIVTALSLAVIVGSLLIFWRGVLWLREKAAQINAYILNNYARTIEVRGYGARYLHLDHRGYIVDEPLEPLPAAPAPATPNEPPDPDVPDIPLDKLTADDSLRRLAIDILSKSAQAFGPTSKVIMPHRQYGGDPSRWVDAVALMKHYGVITIRGKGTFIVAPSLAGVDDLRMQLVMRKTPMPLMSFAAPPPSGGNGDSP
ncbi:MAG: hypothetical protein A2Z17_07130 [Gammaproteobacteria bacterium RBG_16_66_13]|nr:MAG: hypothetical protein A2Z17_07130 [Gammaproteobacteria bacterium RBG_16_66_13]